MKCPYCGNEMRKGIAYPDDTGSTTVIYEEGKKTGLFERPKNEPVVFVRYRRDQDEAYRCAACGKVIVILDEKA